MPLTKPKSPFSKILMISPSDDLENFIGKDTDDTVNHLSKKIGCPAEAIIGIHKHTEGRLFSGNRPFKFNDRSIACIFKLFLNILFQQSRK